MTQTLAAIRTRPTAFQTEATVPNMGVLANGLLMLRFQIRRVRALRTLPA